MQSIIRHTARVVAASLVAATAVAQSTIPGQLGDREFWQLVTDVSEPGGSFRSDNFVSNEMGFLYPIPELKRTTKPGGVTSAWARSRISPTSRRSSRGWRCCSTSAGR